MYIDWLRATKYTTDKMMNQYILIHNSHLVFSKAGQNSLKNKQTKNKLICFSCGILKLSFTHLLLLSQHEKPPSSTFSFITPLNPPPHPL